MTFSVSQQETAEWLSFCGGAGPLANLWLDYQIDHLPPVSIGHGECANLINIHLDRSERAGANLQNRVSSPTCKHSCSIALSMTQLELNILQL